MRVRFEDVSGWSTKEVLDWCDQTFPPSAAQFRAVVEEFRFSGTDLFEIDTGLLFDLGIAESLSRRILKEIQLLDRQVRCAIFFLRKLICLLLRIGNDAKILKIDHLPFIFFWRGRDMPKGREKERELRRKHRKNQQRLKALERTQQKAGAKK